MIRLISIEWLKLKNYKAFWVMFALYFVGLFVICSSGMLLLEYFKNQGVSFKDIDPTIIPLYDFPDVWQNMVYVATYFKLFLAFIIIISVTNEINFRTLRQNIIDGLSKKEFLVSKLILIVILAALATLFLFLLGLVMGGIYSSTVNLKDIFSKLEFFPAYFLEVCTFLSLAFLLSILIKKTGFVIVLLFMYTLILEPIGVLILEESSFLTDNIDWMLPYMPIKALNNLISFPFTRYVFMKIQDFVAWKDVIVVLIWLLIYNFLILFFLKRKNV